MVEDDRYRAGESYSIFFYLFTAQLIESVSLYKINRDGRWIFLKRSGKLKAYQRKGGT